MRYFQGNDIGVDSDAPGMTVAHTSKVPSPWGERDRVRGQSQLRACPVNQPITPIQGFPRRGEGIGSNPHPYSGLIGMTVAGCFHNSDDNDRERC